MRRIENEKRELPQTADITEMTPEENAPHIEADHESHATPLSSNEVHNADSLERVSIKLPNLFSHIGDSDTAFIIAIMFVLFQEGCQDWILYCILGYLIF